MEAKTCNGDIVAHFKLVGVDSKYQSDRNLRISLSYLFQLFRHNFYIFIQTCFSIIILEATENFCFPCLKTNVKNILYIRFSCQLFFDVMLFVSRISPICTLALNPVKN